ncbi:MFS transporter [Szabonella alba]|uniref:MFS transporter n=1 Tax=Szabonella alba TaxID=2804194 RepID=A0A8K0V7N5_9RHOB|nr:MFS transporter [Szabonella alba]MBL4916987.1 MFS transporter [Szabonella alba]
MAQNDRAQDDRSRPAPALSLLPWSLFAALIAAAGLPIYIHAPKFYVDTYGVPLATLGVALFALRLLDVVQDPALGWLAERTRRRRGVLVAGAVLLIAGAMAGLFALPPPIAPLAWFALMLALLFSAFSFLTICFYAQGVVRGAALPGGHLALAGWRETGALIGISLAAIAPVALAPLTDRPFTGFALGFAVLALVAALAMRREWRAAPPPVAAPAGPSFAALLADPALRGLLLLALVNAAPVAVTSTLFLFFVESRLAEPALAGPLLLLFFLSAALTAPAWGRLAHRIGARRALLAGMGLAIPAFALALTLGPGQVALFAVICAASGAALAADMVLLPAILARHLAARGAEAMGFGLWSFASKSMLAVAAVTLFPLLDLAGFRAGGANDAGALQALTLLYAGLPCALKLGAIALLWRSRALPD